MKTCVFQLLALALGMATSASADELDALIYKLRGSPLPKKVVESALVAPQRHADLADKLRDVTTPLKVVAPSPVEQQCQTAGSQKALPVAALPPPAARPPDSKPPPAARPPAPATPPLTAHASKQRSDTSPLKVPDSASVKKDITLKTVPEKHEVEKNETIFPVGSKPSRCADSRLKVVVPKAGTHMFPAGSRAFRLKDGTLKVSPPKPATPDSEIVYQN